MTITSGIRMRWPLLLLGEDDMATKWERVQAAEDKYNAFMFFIIEWNNQMIQMVLQIE